MQQRWSFCRKSTGSSHLLQWVIGLQQHMLIMQKSEDTACVTRPVSVHWFGAFVCLNQKLLSDGREKECSRCLVQLVVSASTQLKPISWSMKAVNLQFASSLVESSYTYPSRRSCHSHQCKNQYQHFFVLCDLDLWPFCPKIDGFLGITVEHYYVEFGRPSCGDSWDTM